MDLEKCISEMKRQYKEIYELGNPNNLRQIWIKGLRDLSSSDLYKYKKIKSKIYADYNRQRIREKDKECYNKHKEKRIEKQLKRDRNRKEETKK